MGQPPRRRTYARIEQLEPRWLFAAGLDDSASLRSDVTPPDAAAWIRDRWDLDGRGQTVAVIDSGIAYDHVALGGGLGPEYRVVGGWDFTDEQDADPYDDGPAGFHGTHIAGILAASDEQHAGIVPGVDLAALRVFDDRGIGQFAWVEQALNWVHEHRNAFANPITTVNLSVGSDWNDLSPPDWAQLEDEFEQLRHDGIFVAVSAGNGFDLAGEVGLSYPGSSALVVPVASVDDRGQLSAFSQRDPRVLAAPGEQITSTVPDHLFGSDGIADDWAAVSGTSMATPYVAGASVLVRQAFDRFGLDDPDPVQILNHLRDTADSVFDSVTGNSYLRLNLRRAIESIAPVVPATRHLGIVDQWDLTVARDQPGSRYAWNTSRAGMMTVEVAGASGVAPQFTVIDPMSGRSRVYRRRADINVSAGQSFELQLQDPSAATRVTIVNLVRRLGSTVEVFGTQGDDQFTLDLNSTEQLQINGVAYRFTDSVKSFVVDGHGGHDTARVVGTAAAETVTVRGRSMTMTNGTTRVDTRQIDVLAVDGRAGHDYARVFGDGDHGEFVFREDEAQWHDDLAAQQLVGFERFHVYARGRESVAKLHDTPHDDSFQATPTWSQLTAPGQSVYVSGFRYVYGYAIHGGQDRAALFDSADDDLFEARPTVARMSGHGYLNQAYGFDNVYGYATGGTRDIARLYDHSGDDILQAHPEYALFRGHSLWNYAQGFDYVYAYSIAGGHDRAMMFDSAGDDWLESRSESVRFLGSGFNNYAYGFEQVYAYSRRGGWDQTTLAGTNGADRFVDQGPYATLSGPEMFRYVEGFDRMVVAMGLGKDTARVRLGRGGRCSGSRAIAVLTDSTRQTSIHNADGVTLELDAEAVDCVFGEL